MIRGHTTVVILMGAIGHRAKLNELQSLFCIILMVKSTRNTMTMFLKNFELHKMQKMILGIHTLQNCATTACHHSMPWQPQFFSIPSVIMSWQHRCHASTVLTYSCVMMAISKTLAIDTINISAPVSSCHDMLATPAPMPRQPLILTLVCNFSHRWPY